MVSHNQNHFIVISFPAQGHLNPTLQFAKRLLRNGARVTYFTTLSSHKRMLESSSNTSNIDGLTYAPFSDGYDDGYKGGLDDANHFLSEIARCGSQALRELIQSAHDGGSGSVTCIIYAILVPWVAEVARDLQVPSFLLWIQPATVFDIYYYYYNGYKDVLSNNNNDPSYPINLPNLPVLSCKDIPTFFLPTNLYPWALSLFENQFKVFEEESKPVKILVNTFDELELDALKAVDVNKINLIGIGPLIPSAFLDGQDLSDKSFGGDLVTAGTTDEYKDWLDSREEASVIYVSFGSVSVLEHQQMEEIFRGLTECGFPFLWVCREKESKQEGREAEKEEESVLSRIKTEGSEQGKIVSWCSQVEVLSHSSIGCFITHCGWNSTLESLVGGVPLIGFPQWTDQGTNAKLIEDVWKVGVRMRVNEETKIVDREEVSRRVKMVMRNEEMKINANKWKELARNAAKEGGSSDRNLRGFVEEIGGLLEGSKE